MKVLLVDVGNTRLKWAVLDQGQGQERLGPMASCEYADEDVALLLDRQWSALAGVGRVLLASVGGAAFTQALQRYLQQRWGFQAELLVSPATGWGVTNAYAEPQRLGIDRWLTLIAARRLAAGSVWVVDCGTAVTIDRLDAEGRHLGGLIMPGLAMMMQALAVGTAQLPADGDVRSDEVARLATDTTAAVACGVLTTLVAAIDRIIHDTAPLSDVAVTAVITGGNALRLQPLLAGRWLNQPQLVLQGMALMAEGKE